MKLAVFTSWYPARITTFFERDMRALVDAGVEVDVFAIAPLDPAMWQHSLDLLSSAPVFLREKVQYADNIITCCEFNQRYIARAFPGARTSRKVHVCHHGLDLSRFPYRAEDRDGNRILAVGRLRKHKGFDYLIRAAALLAQRGHDFSLEIVGDGDERDALQALAAELGIADRLRLRGWLSLSEVLQTMGEATVLVHPSEGLGDG